LPDSSSNVPVPGAPTSREASAQAAAADGHLGVPAQSGTGLGDTAPTAVRTTITVPDSVSMVALLGSGDELLRLVENEVETDVHVRAATRSR